MPTELIEHAPGMVPDTGVQMGAARLWEVTYSVVSPTLIPVDVTRYTVSSYWVSNGKRERRYHRDTSRTSACETFEEARTSLLAYLEHEERLARERVRQIEEKHKHARDTTRSAWEAKRFG